MSNAKSSDSVAGVFVGFGGLPLAYGREREKVKKKTRLQLGLNPRVQQQNEMSARQRIPISLDQVHMHTSNWLRFSIRSKIFPLVGINASYQGCTMHKRQYWLLYYIAESRCQLDLLEMFLSANERKSLAHQNRRKRMTTTKTRLNGHERHARTRSRISHQELM